MIRISSPTGVWSAFCSQIVGFLEKDTITLKIDGRVVRGYRSPDTPALWIRDHSDILRGGRYVEPDVTSAIECFADAQSANGRIFDYVTTFPEKKPCERENWEKWVRVPVEADVEYRFVKAVHIAWQASGDSGWAASMLPACDRALRYTIEHPLRWDARYKLVKRPYTIDTWDFDYTAGRVPWLNFAITENTYWGISHCDNSGVLQSAALLSEMYAAAGDDDAAGRWQEVAAGIRTRANSLLFNGRFYTHFHKLSDVEIAGVDEEAQLSLSNPAAINRGLASHDQAVAILREYQQRSETTDAFAPWFAIDPPFPDGIFGDEKLVGGAYINGGVFPLVGGELARAAFEHGFETWGLQILRQYREMITESGETYLWYFRDGTPSTVETSTSPEATPTDGWGSSAMLYAFTEGLCGIVDTNHSFTSVRCSPRWTVTDEIEADVELSYAASGASFGYRFRHLENGRILLGMHAQKARVSLHLLLPSGCRATGVTVDGQDVPFQSVMVESSPYADAEVDVSGHREVEVHYALY